MSGGIAYVLDENEKFNSRVNKEMVIVEKPNNEDIEFLKDIITEHYTLTNSLKAKTILDDFDLYITKFKKVIPKDYKEVLELVKINEEKNILPFILDGINEDTIEEAEISNGKVLKAEFIDGSKINMGQINYDTGKYIIIGTPIIFVTY